MRRFVAVVKAKSGKIHIIKFQNRNNMIKCHTYAVALAILYNCGA